VSSYPDKSIIAAAIVAMAIGFTFSLSLNNSDQKISENVSTAQLQIQGTVLEPARKIALPPLVKDDGSQFVDEDLKNHWSLLFFGYTHCPDICPTTLSVLARSAKRSSEQLNEFPAVFFISVDPQRDTVDMIGEYVKYFDKSFTAVTGEKKMIEALTLQAGVVYFQTPSTIGNENDYIVDHSASVLLINPEGRLRAYLRPPHSPESILKSIKILSMKNEK